MNSIAHNRGFGLCCRLEYWEEEDESGAAADVAAVVGGGDVGVGLGGDGDERVQSLEAWLHMYPLPTPEMCNSHCSG